MAPRYTSYSSDINEGHHHHARKSEANCTLRHTTGGITSPDDIGTTPALQKARQEELNRKPLIVHPLVTLPSFRESFPQSLSEPELTPTCTFDKHHGKYNLKAVQCPGATFAPQLPLVVPHMKNKFYICKNRVALPHHAETISLPCERLTYEPVRDADTHSLPPPSDDDTCSVSSSSGLDSNAEANYSPMIRSFAEYRYPPLLPEPRPQQRLSQITPQYLHRWDNQSAPPSSSTSNVSERRRVQATDNTRGLPDRPRQALPRPIGNDLKWLEYAEEVRDEKGVHYQCRWEKGGRLPTACDYRAQKQAMKRHIEATHLKYKPHKCSFCHKAYSQKTALEVHEATHTGATPHECLFGCGMAFSDPARRYRHHVEIHGYVPRQTNKKHGNAQMRVVRDKIQYGT